VFVDSYTDRSTYTVAVNVLNYLSNETDYLPWRTVYHHVIYLLKVLDYDKAFLQISSFFITELSKLERDELWEPSNVHIEELFRETIIELSCRLQDSYCINKTAELWPKVFGFGTINSTNIIPPYVRSLVYNYHFQNTYDVSDWLLIFRLYKTQNDLVEKERYLKALTFTRLPWLLANLVKEIDNIDELDVFDLFKYLSAQPIGREIAWDYVRNNFNDIENEYGLDDPRLGHLLIDIASSFENEFMFYELLEFIFFSETGATANYRFKALEISSTNLIWLLDNERELVNAFGAGGVVKSKSSSKQNEQAITAESLKAKLREMYVEVKAGKRRHLRNDTLISREL